MNKSEQTVMEVIEGRKNWRTLYKSEQTVLAAILSNEKTVSSAIESLKRKGLIVMDKNSILREAR